MKEKNIYIIFTGFSGSGKTEIVLNYSLFLSKNYSKIRIIDLDVVKPLFRLRNLKVIIPKNIEVIYPEKSVAFLDLPILTSIMPMDDKPTLIDLGGEEKGLKILKSLSAFLPQNFDILLVINPFRPYFVNPKYFSDLVKGWEEKFEFRFSGIISNPNLGAKTDLKTIKKGADLIEEVAELIDRRIYFISIKEDLADKVFFSYSILPIKVFMSFENLFGGI
ncbi:MAG: hypothetical protein ACPLKX_02830 [Dictyoglomaceae bacterium]